MGTLVRDLRVGGPYILDGDDHDNPQSGTLEVLSITDDQDIGMRVINYQFSQSQSPDIYTCGLNQIDKITWDYTLRVFPPPVIQEAVTFA